MDMGFRGWMDGWMSAPLSNVLNPRDVYKMNETGSVG